MVSNIVDAGKSVAFSAKNKKGLDRNRTRSGAFMADMTYIALRSKMQIQPHEFEFWFWFYVMILEFFVDDLSISDHEDLLVHSV